MLKVGELPLITTPNLKNQTRDQLAKLAKTRGVTRSNNLSKEQLLKALAKPAAEAARQVADICKSARNRDIETAEAGFAQ